MRFALGFVTEPAFAANPCLESMEAKAVVPKPIPEFSKKERRDWRRSKSVKRSFILFTGLGDIQIVESIDQNGPGSELSLFFRVSQVQAVANRIRQRRLFKIVLL